MPDPVRRCPVCRSGGAEQIYRSGSARSLSSLGEAMEGEKTVFACHRCGHLFADALTDTAAYYANDYNILLDGEDEDQIYEIREGRTVTRTAHQMAVLGSLGGVSTGMQVLDYGAAKGAMARLMKSGGADVHVFDVSENYVPFWARFLDEDRQANGFIPDHWHGRFDLITSFFAFEHIDDPVAAIRMMVSLLAANGRVHIVVPDVFGNRADFIVADHVNHFTLPSMTRLLSDAGLADIAILDDRHRGALVATARKTEAAGTAKGNSDIETTLENALDLARFWTGAGDAIRQAEAHHTGPGAIYGSGFYGAYILSQLSRPDAIRFVLDKSPWRQGKDLSGIPVIAPEALPDTIAVLYAGLNPAIARNVIESQPQLCIAGRQIVYLA